MRNSVSFNRKLGTLLLWCVGSVSPVFAQTYNLSVPVTDSTGTDSPLAIHGDVSFQVHVFSDNVKTEWDTNIILTNISNKPIIAYELAIDAKPDLGAGVHFLEQVDHFFRPNLTFLPGTQQSVKVLSRILQTSPRKEDSLKDESKAIVKVLFVEFNDGSRFGQSKWSNGLSDARKGTLGRIQEILNTVQLSGPEALEASLQAELARQDSPALTKAVINHLRETLSARGPDAAVSELNEVSNTAEERKLIR